MLVWNDFDFVVHVDQSINDDCKMPGTGTHEF